MSAFGSAFGGGVGSAPVGPAPSAPPPPQVLRFKAITATGTFTVPAGVSRLHARLWGGGGSGSSPAASAGGGGASGGFVEASVPVTPGQVLICQLGKGGPGVAAGVGAGKAGGDTKLQGDSWQLIAAGGGGALNATAGGAPGTSGAITPPAGSDIFFAQGIHGAFATQATGLGGSGASSPFGGPGAGVGVGYPGGSPGGGSGGAEYSGGMATSTQGGADGLLLLSYLEPLA